jgi:hypothetical protein
MAAALREIGLVNMPRHFLAWAERRPIRYLYAVAVAGALLLSALITYCEVFV